MSKCPTLAGRDGTEPGPCCAFPAIPVQRLLQRAQAGEGKHNQAVSTSTIRTKNFSPTVCLRDIGLGLMSWWVRTLLNICLGLVYFKTLTT